MIDAKALHTAHHGSGYQQALQPNFSFTNRDELNAACKYYHCEIIANCRRRSYQRLHPEERAVS